MENYLSYLRELNMCSMMLRIVMAMFFGGFIGFERERKGRAAGFRTYMLVALGAAVTQILSQYLDLMLSTQWLADMEIVGRRTDVVRLGARVVSGVGFLGTGTIFVTSKREVKGLTTAAGFWASACMGLAVGAGFYEGMAVAFVLIVICMNILPLVETAIMSKSLNMVLYLETENIENLSGIISFIKREEIHIFEVEIDKENHQHSPNVNAVIDLRLPVRLQHAELLAALSTLNGVITIEEV